MCMNIYIQYTMYKSKNKYIYIYMLCILYHKHMYILHIFGLEKIVVSSVVLPYARA